MTIDEILTELDDLEEEGHTGAPVIVRLRNHARLLIDTIRSQQARIADLHTALEQKQESIEWAKERIEIKDRLLDRLEFTKYEPNKGPICFWCGVSPHTHTPSGDIPNKHRLGCYWLEARQALTEAE